MQENLRRGYNLVSLRLLFQYIHIMWQTDNRHYESYQHNTSNQRIFSDALLQSRYLPKNTKALKPCSLLCSEAIYICYQNYQGSEITGRKINHISSLCQLMLILLVIKQNLCLKWDKLNSLLDKLYRNVVTLYDLICNCINVQK